MNVLSGLVICAMATGTIIASLTASRMTPHKRQFYFRILASLVVLAAFIPAIIEVMNGGEGRVSLELGRPAIILTITALFIDSVIQNRRRGC